MALSPELTAMLERLVRLPAADRDFVLDRLDPDQRTRLLPMLARAGRVELSPVLKTAVTIAQRGDVPDGMTLRATEALAKAARAAEASVPAPAPATPRGAGWLARLGLGG